MRGLAKASLLVLLIVSAIGSTVAAYATLDKGAPSCGVPSLEDDTTMESVFRRARAMVTDTKALTRR